MFERYTEKARRVIFFARYEAIQFGSPYIETEHILLGVLREDRRIIVMLHLQDSAESIRREIEAITHGYPRISVSVDLPLSNESKRVLAYAAEEAELLGHKHIGTEHLVLGLMREETGLAAELLRQKGLNISELRSRFAQSPSHQSLTATHHDTYHAPGKDFQSATARNTIEIHGLPWDADYIRIAVNRCREFPWHWHKRDWTSQDIVVDRSNGKTSFDLHLAEQSTDFALIPGGWKKDYCCICRWELFEARDDPEHGQGYTNGRDWVCIECYENFIARPGFFTSNFPEIT